MTDPMGTMPSWFPEIQDPHPVPQARSLAEMAEGVFRTQDLQARADVEADKQRRRSQAVKLADLADEAQSRAFMGRETPSAIEYYLAVSEAQDRAEEHDRKRREKLRAEAAERRVAELEAELAAAEQDRARSTRTLRQANEGWAAERRRSEAAEQGAGFRGDRSYVRSVDNAIIGIR